MFNFDCPATITLSHEQVAEVIAYAFEKRYGLKLPVDRLTVQYDSDYDSTTFAGYKIALNMLEVVQMKD